MKKIIAAFIAGCLLALIAASNVSAGSVIYLAPKYEKMAQAFIKKTIDAKSQFEDEGEYYDFLVSLDAQLKVYRAKNYSKIPYRNLANRLLSEVAVLREEYEDDAGEDPDGLIDPTTLVTSTPTATITASPTGITVGGNSRLTWSSKNASKCTVMKSLD